MTLNQHKYSIQFMVMTKTIFDYKVLKLLENGLDQCPVKNYYAKYISK